MPPRIPKRRSSASPLGLHQGSMASNASVRGAGFSPGPRLRRRLAVRCSCPPSGCAVRKQPGPSSRQSAILRSVRPTSLQVASGSPPPVCSTTRAARLCSALSRWTAVTRMVRQLIRSCPQAADMAQACASARPAGTGIPAVHLSARVMTRPGLYQRELVHSSAEGGGYGLGRAGCHGVSLVRSRYLPRLAQRCIAVMIQPGAWHAHSQKKGLYCAAVNPGPEAKAAAAAWEADRLLAASFLLARSSGAPVAAVCSWQGAPEALVSELLGPSLSVLLGSPPPACLSVGDGGLCRLGRGVPAR